MDISKAIKAMIKRSGMTQQSLASRIGTGQTNIAMFVKSNMAIKVENIMRIADACGYDIALVNRKDNSDVLLIGEKDEISIESGLEKKIRQIVAEEMSKAK